MTIETDIIKSIPYFTGLSSAELDSISRYLFEKKAERGEAILFEGEPAEAMFFVASGAVKIYKTSVEGKEQILSIVRPGNAFNDVPIFDKGLNPTSAEAMGPVTLWGIKGSELEIILGEYPQVVHNVIKVLAERVRQLVSLVEDLSFKRVIGRVARILLEQASDGSGSGTHLTQQEMAAMAGTVREVVARSLKTLEDEGTIRLERHRIVIADKEALQEVMEA
jgi:CRP/FNR family transcriptional regulator